jgi:predicted Zn finger-like uncharacterized protein
MLKLRCPGCEAALRIDEAKRGRPVRCPKCDHRFTVPAPPPAEEDEETEELLVVERPKKKKPKSYGLKDEPTAPRPMPRYDRGNREDPERPRIRKKGRSKGQATGFIGFLTADWNLDKIVVVLAVGLWLTFTGVSLVPFVFGFGLLGLFGVGLLMLSAGRIWAIIAAFSEDAGTGCLTLAFPWYGLFSIEDRRPLFLTGVGILYIVTGVGMAFLNEGMGRMAGG